MRDGPLSALVDSRRAPSFRSSRTLADWCTGWGNTGVLGVVEVPAGVDWSTGWTGLACRLGWGRVLTGVD